MIGRAVYLGGNSRGLLPRLGKKSEDGFMKTRMLAGVLGAVLGAAGMFSVAPSGAAVARQMCKDQPATIWSTDGRHVLDGTGGHDVIVGTDGDDVVRGHGGAD